MAEYEQARERGEQVTAPAPMPFDRPTQERRAKRAERELDELGRVNPLALEEFAALEERYNFLSTQLEDVKATRADLLDVVRDVDDTHPARCSPRPTTTSSASSRRCSRRCSPAARAGCCSPIPTDMLTTGIEVEARPPGKKIKRLSLLSGGEKSLTAVAMLVRHLPGPAVAVLRAWTRSRPRSTTSTCAACSALFEQLRERVAADRHHPPEADDGGRRRAVRRDHARRRHHRGDLATHAGPGAGDRRLTVAALGDGCHAATP